MRIDEGSRRRAPGRLRVLAVGLALVAGGGAAEAQSVVPAAGGASLAVTDEFSAFLLPYTPFIFDALVYGGRNFAAITYGSRRFDPLTQAFVVTDLHLRRDDLSFTIGQIRAGAGTTLLNNIAVDTRALPLDPAVREALQRLGSETVTGSVAVSVGEDAPSASYRMAISADFDRIGRLSAAADVEGFHVLLPLEGMEAPGATPSVVGRLAGARLAFDDAGLASVLYETIGEAQGVPADQIRGIASAGAAAGLSEFVNVFYGQDREDVAKLTADWLPVLQGFIEDPHHIELRMLPDEPVDLERFQTGAPDAGVLLALNPILSQQPVLDVALVDLASDDAPEGLELARRMIEGVGLPQDVEGGLALAAQEAATGSAEAARLVGKALAADPQASLPAAASSRAYALLLVAAASGERVQPAALEALRSRLGPEAVADAEDEARADFQATAAGSVRDEAEAAAIAAHDWPRIRDFAFDYLEGTQAPRNVVQAHALASVAAAGGDLIAATLRDDLARGARDGRLTLSAERARRVSDTLWRELLSKTP